ncbi:MAG: DMT family transporter [Oscillospiraceae bacterium]|nr:DMT family transporter [Oscillospiraceae bacterium]
MREKVKGSLSLLAATVIWGFAFIAQSVGMDLIGPFTFQAVRCLLAVVFLVPCAFALDLGKCSLRESARKWQNKDLWKAGILCGCALFVAASLQQIGLVYTDAGKAGFITAMYIVLTPVLGLFLGRRVPKSTAFSVLIAVVGLYLLSCMGVTQVNKGDLFLMGCALAFAVQINCIDHFAPGLDGFRLNCIQALTVAVLSVPFMVLTEQVDVSNLLACWGPLCFAGMLSMGLAYSLQIVGQKTMEPAPAALIMSLESVFAALGGWWLLQEQMTPAELTGCGLVFAAVVISQLPEKKRNG